MKQKTATQVRRHAKGKTSCTDQSGLVGLEQTQKRKEGIRWQMQKGRGGGRCLSGECS